MRPADATALAELAEPLRSRLTAFLTENPLFSIVSGRRSFEEQVALRKAHCGSSWEAIYTWPASSCSPPTAKPGSSKHETGLAADLAGPLGSAGAALHAAGLHRPVSGEDWHVEVDPAAVGYLTNGIPGPIDDAAGEIFGGVEDAVGNVLGGLVDPLVKGIGRIALVGVLLLGGVGLVALGGLRGTGGGGALAAPGLSTGGGGQ